MKLNYVELKLIDKDENGNKFKCYSIEYDGLRGLLHISQELKIPLNQLIDIVKKFNGKKYHRYPSSEYYYFINEKDVQNALFAINFIFNI